MVDQPVHFDYILVLRRLDCRVHSQISNGYSPRPCPPNQSAWSQSLMGDTKRKRYMPHLSRGGHFLFVLMSSAIIQGPERFEVFIRHCHERITDWFPTIRARSATEVMAGARCYPACRPTIDWRSLDPPIQQKVVAPNVVEIMIFRVAF